MTSPLDHIADEIRQLRADNREIELAVDEEIKKRRARDQSRIAWLIIWAFVVAIGSIFLLVVGGLLLGEECGAGDPECDPERWENAATFLLGIVSSVLLPVVTLVLGYYFGREKRE